ncbi:unnamed protein product, partial [marine sediment metagenome]
DGFIFDYGIHGLFPSQEDNKKIINKIKSLLGDELETVSKKTLLYFNKKYLNYPLTLKDMVIAMNPFMSFLCFLDFLKARLKKKFRMETDESSFKSAMTNNFGVLLYNRFFGPYAHKVWGVRPDLLNSRWLGRRVFNKNIWLLIKEVSIKLLKLREKENGYSQQPNKFFYAKNGAQTIAEKMANEILKKNMRIVVNSEIKKIIHKDGKIQGVIFKKDGKDIKIDCDYLISSIPINDFVKSLEPAFPEEIIRSASQIQFRAIIILCLLVKKERVLKAQWNYYPDKEFVFNRINEFKNVLPGFAPKGKTGIGIEITCFKNDKIWNLKDDELFRISLENLKKLNLIKKDDIEKYNVVRLPSGYPIDRLDIKVSLDKVFNELKNIGNLYLIGREGLFRYINMDESIKTGFEAAQSIIDKEIKL